LLLTIVFDLLCINKNNNKRNNKMTQIGFQSISILSTIQLTQYIDDHIFTNAQKMQIFEHYNSTNTDTTNIYSKKKNIKNIKKNVKNVKKKENSDKLGNSKEYIENRSKKFYYIGDL
ncbi:hypothetical protein, partial [Streptococcus suis]